ncbi:pyridoxal-phosphate dependent enzyme [Lysobacter sp. BMK333-48F3]|uniref:pyridoxal-phosphate dependent enzyme n=1 Tax=Lysobacter sp. BMK333-48F3 TaxID=2867962 RepID=UPI001C8CECCF|nr:pyridoxal-phosphate dependent enzyme [Lysobacter sp. BMK333-48F3]MBX9400263.1 pyridoxal-phosphate dependent enzyme [Lysobacter sp. BMK333-48F3]
MNDHWLDDPAALWPDYRPTPLLDLPALAHRLGVARVLAKAENERPLGNFKALGGLTAGLRALARATGATDPDDLRRRCRQAPPRLLCASDGNHGLAVTAAAQRAQARARVYLPAAVSAARAQRIAALGGEVVRVGGSYDDAVLAARAAAGRGEGLLIADTSDDRDDPVVADVMAGYGLIARELRAQLPTEARDRPSHVFVQAGVGGLAAALADGLHGTLQATARIVVVEPASAACVMRALAAARPVRLPGELATVAEMLSCGLVSSPALAVLARHRAAALTVDEDELLAAPQRLREHGGPASTPSGGAGLAGLWRAAADPALRERHALDAHSVVLLTITEGAAPA